MSLSSLLVSLKLGSPSGKPTSLLSSFVLSLYLSLILDVFGRGDRRFTAKLLFVCLPFMGTSDKARGVEGCSSCVVFSVKSGRVCSSCGPLEGSKGTVGFFTCGRSKPFSLNVCDELKSRGLGACPICV